jgi:hypothetical protein
MSFPRFHYSEGIQTGFADSKDNVTWRSEDVLNYPVKRWVVETFDYPNNIKLSALFTGLSYHLIERHGIARIPI